jgi:hypothetical protein
MTQTNLEIAGSARFFRSLLGAKTVREVEQVKKRVLSAAAKAKISKATKARWVRFRAEKNKKAKAA